MAELDDTTWPPPPLIPGPVAEDDSQVDAGLSAVDKLILFFVVPALLLSVAVWLLRGAAGL